VAIVGFIFSISISVDLPTLNLRLSPRPVMALELGSHPKPTQIAEALVYVGEYPLWSPA
jgi:hypothetical protein